MSNIRHDVGSVSPGRVRDVSVLGSTSTATIFNMQNTGNIILVAAGENGRKGTGVSFAASSDVVTPARDVGVTGSCRCTAFCGRVGANSNLGPAFSSRVVRGFGSNSSPIHFPDIS